MFNEYVYPNGVGDVSEKEPRFPWVLFIGLILLLLMTVGICRADVATAPKENIVQLYSDHMNGGKSTGFILERGRVITAKHVCLSTKKKLILVYYDGRTETVKKKNVYISKKYDLAVIYTKKDKIGCTLWLSKKKHRAGIKIYSVGHPWGIKTQIFVEGIVSSKIWEVCSGSPRIPSWEKAYYSTLCIEPGASGSPVFDNSDGLMGIAVAHLGSYSIIHGRESLKEFLHAAAKARAR